MNNKRGLSTIIITLILIALALVAIGIFWIVVRNMIQSGVEEINLGKFTLSAGISNVNIDNSTNNVSLTVKRNPGAGELSGIEFIFSDGLNSEVVKREVSMKELQERRFSFILNMNVNNLISISIVPIIKKDNKEFFGNIMDKYLVKEGISLGPGGGVCTSSSCSVLGYQCGTWANGTCSGTLNCGSCTGGQVCNASGRCVASCTPTTCSALGYTCGIWANGTCSGSLNCGNCSSGYSCVGGSCVAETGYVYAASCNYGDVSSAINSASSGDTVVVPAGNCTWSSTLAITKGITLKGAGIGNTTITGNVEYTMPTPTLYTFFRFTGFSLNGIVQLYNQARYYAGRVRIDHNSLTSTGSVLRTWGNVYGVVDYNTIKMGDSFYIFGDDNNAWTYITFAYGTEATLFIEDNDITFTSTVNSLFQDSGVGTMFVLRYNNYTFNCTGTSNIYWWDMHGNQGTGSNKAAMGAEIYGNKLVSITASNLQVIDHRGGSLLIFWNKAVSGITGSAWYQTREECDDCLNGHTPCIGPSGQPMRVSNSYYWNNRYGSNLVTSYTVTNGGRGDCIAPTYNITLGVDVFKDNGNGVSCGTLASLPSTCTTGVGYWATSQSCSSIDSVNIGTNPSVPISGTLYKCNSTNTWIAYYTPYTYPHPLTLIP